MTKRTRSGGGEVGGCKNECESVAVGDGECSLLAAYMRDARRATLICVMPRPVVSGDVSGANQNLLGAGLRKNLFFFCLLGKTGKIINKQKGI